MFGATAPCLYGSNKSLLLLCIENKNRNHSINLVKIQVYDRLLIDKKHRRNLGFCGFSLPRYSVNSFT